MQHLYIARPGDKESILSYYQTFQEKTNTELVEDYNQQVNTGIVGVHQQVLYLIGLYNAMMKRFGKSPITVEDNVFIGLSGRIVLKGDTYEQEVE